MINKTFGERKVVIRLAKKDFSKSVEKTITATPNINRSAVGLSFPAVPEEMIVNQNTHKKGFKRLSPNPFPISENTPGQLVFIFNLLSF
jgi:hypothetical protein